MTTKSIEETFNQQQTKLNIKRAFTDLLSDEGYLFYEPETFEPYDAFIRVNERIKPSSMVKVLDNTGHILVLRPDVTTTIINQLIPRFRNGGTIKLFYDTDIYAQSNGGVVEKMAQFGVEYLGSSTSTEASDSETVNLMLKLCDLFNVDYVVEIGNQKFLDALFKQMALPNEALHELKEIITNKNVSLLSAFMSRHPIKVNDKKLLDMLFRLEGDIDDIEEKLTGIRLDNRMKEALNELRLLRSTIETTTLKRKIIFDLSMLSKYDYYQGITFQGFTPSANRALIKGGRYNPINKTTNQRIPAIGFTIDMDALVKAVNQNG